jgi:hypothetical protein
MPAYFRGRLDIFVVSAFVGGAVSAVLFQYRSDQLSRYFDLPVLHKFLFPLLVLAYALPTLCAYLVLYLVNKLSIYIFGGTELDQGRRRAAKRLVEALIRSQSTVADPIDLVDEAAWLSLQEYWRSE